MPQSNNVLLTFYLCILPIYSSSDDTHIQGTGVRLKSVPILDRRQGLKYDDVYPWLQIHLNRSNLRS